MSLPFEPRSFASPPRDGFAFFTQALTCLRRQLSAVRSIFLSAATQHGRSVRNDEGRTVRSAPRLRLLVDCQGYQKLPWPSAAFLQPPSPCVAHVRVLMPVVESFVIVNVLFDFDVPVIV